MNPTKKLSWAKKGAQQAAKSMKNLAIHLLRVIKLTGVLHVAIIILVGDVFLSSMIMYAHHGYFIEAEVIVTVSS